MEFPIIIIIIITNFSIINLITTLGHCGTYITLHKPLLYMWWLAKLVAVTSFTVAATFDPWIIKVLIIMYIYIYMTRNLYLKG